MGIDSVCRVVLRVQRVLQVELDVLQNPLDHVLDVDSFGHVRRRHDVKRRQAGIGRLGHALHDELAPQTLLVHGVVALQNNSRGMRREQRKRTKSQLKKTIKSTYVIHHGGEFDAVPDVHLQDVQHFDQFIRRKLSK